MQRLHMKSLTAVAASILVLGGLTACSTASDEATEANGGVEGCATSLAPGVLSDNVILTGEAGDAPKVQLPEGAAVYVNQRTLHPASDATDSATRAEKVVEDTALVGVKLSMFDSVSGEQLYASAAYADDSQPPEYLISNSSADADPLSNAVACTVAGDRVVLALDPETSMALAQQLGGAAAGSIVVIMDIESVTPTVSSGAVRGLPAGFPAVVTNEDGQPGVVLPPTDGPEGLNVATRIAGNGSEVTAESSVIANVLVVDAETGAVTQNTWESGIIGIGSEADIAQSGATYRAAVTGANVGSQLVIVENTDDARQVVVIDVIAVT